MMYTKEGDQNFKPYTHLLAALSCFFWFFCSLQDPEEDKSKPVHALEKTIPLFPAVNALGVGSCVFYMIVLAFFYQRRRKFKLLYTVVGMTAITSVLIIIACFGVTDETMRLHFLGGLGAVVGVLASLCSLIPWRVVYQSSSVDHLFFWSIVTDFLSSSMWTLYGFMEPANYYVVATNILGAISGLVQVVLYIYMYDPTPRPTDIEDP